MAVGVVFFSFTGADCIGQNVDVNALVTQVRENIRLLDSVEYEATVSVLRVDSNGVQSRLKYEVQFKSDGTRYFSRLQLTGNKNERLDRTVAFDGAEFEAFDEDLDVLQFTSIPPEGLPYLFPQPFIYIYGFAIGKNNRLDFATLNDPDIWRDFQLNVTSANTIAYEGDQAGAIRLDFDLPDGEGSVILAKNVGLLPVVVQSRSDDVESTLTILEAKEIRHGSNDIFFPTEIVDQARDRTGVLRYELKANLKPASLKVNQPIESSSFKIDRNRARWLDDVDGRLAGTAKIIEINPGPFSTLRLLILMSLTAFCVGAYLLFAICRKGLDTEDTQ